MSQLLADIKKCQLQARKDRDSVKASALTTLIGEIETATTGTGKTLTDEAVVATVKKFITNAKDSRQFAIDGNAADAAARLTAEIAVYEQFMPQQLSEEQLQAEIAAIISIPGQVTQKPNIGAVMAALKSKYAGQYDGALASKLIKAALA